MNNLSLNVAIDIAENYTFEGMKLPDPIKSKITSLIHQVIKNKSNIESISIKEEDKKTTVTLVTDKNRIEIKSSKILSIASDILENRWKNIDLKIKVIPQKLTLFKGTESVSNRLLLHIHGDEFGLNSELQGMERLEPLKYFNNFINSRKGLNLDLFGISQQILTQLNNDMTDFSNLKKRLIKCFSTNEPVQFFGGWKAQAPHGHAMVYEVIPQPNGLATMRIFDTRGAKFFPKLEGEYKDQSVQALEWRGIAQERFLSDDFTKAVEEMITKAFMPIDKADKEKKTVTPTFYSELDVYNALKEILKPKEGSFGAVDKDQQVVLMTSQRSGTCSWKSILAYLRTKMTVEQYKRMKLEIKLQSLQDFMSTVEKNPNEDKSLSDSARWGLVEKSFKKLCRSIRKEYKFKTIDQDFVTQAFKYLRPIQKSIQLGKAKALEIAKKQTPLLQELAYQPPQEVKSFKLQTGSPPLASAVGPPSQPFSFIYDKLSHMKVDDPALIQQTLSTIEKRVQESWDKREDECLHLGLGEVLRHLPIDKNYWITACKNDPAKAQQIIISLGNIVQNYTKTDLALPRYSSIFADKIFGVLKINYIQNTLATVISREWETFQFKEKTPLLFSMNNGINLNLHLQILEGKADRDFLELSRWLYKERDRDKLDLGEIKPDTGQFQHSLHDVTFVKEPRPWYHPLGAYRIDQDPFINFLQKIDPQLISKVSSGSWGGGILFALLQENKKCARIVNSDALPKWYESMLESFLSYRVLSEYYLSSTNEDRSQNLFSKTYKEQSGPAGDDAQVIFKVNGQDPQKYNNKMLLREMFPALKMRQMYKVLNEIDKHLLSSHGETNLLTYEPKYEDEIKYSDSALEELKEIGYLMHRPSLTVSLTLDFFKKHPEKLLDPPYQAILQIFLFQIGLLPEAIKQEGFSDKIVEFITSNMTKSIQDGQLQAAVFFIRMGRYLSRYVDHPSLGNLDRHLYPILDHQTVDPTIKSALYTELIGYLCAKETLTEKEVDDLLIARVYIKLHPVPEAWTTAYSDKEIREGLIKHASSIHHRLTKDGVSNPVLNLILKAVKPDASEQQWTMKVSAQRFPSFCTVDGQCEYYPLSGDLTFPGVAIEIPKHVQEAIKDLFPHATHGRRYADDVISFEDHHGIQTMVKIQENSVRIEQKRDNQWVRYVTLPETFGCPHLIQQCAAWRTMDRDPPSILLVNQKTGQTEYIAELVKKDQDYSLREVRRVSDGALLGTASSLLRTVEEPEYIHEWYREGKLVEVELPRYSLSFKNDSGILYSKEYKGFYLKPDEVLKHFGMYQKYLVLENEKGVKKAILPGYKFDAPKDEKSNYTKMEALEPRFSVSNLPQKYEFNVMKNGKLFSKSREANLYMSQVFLLSQNYQAAAFYLKQYGKKLRAYTQEEVEILLSMIRMHKITGNQEGNALAIQCYAGYLLEKNIRDFPRKEDLQFHAPYAQYLNHYNNVTVLRLTKEEASYLSKEDPMELLAEFFDKEAAAKEDITKIDYKEFAKQAINPLSGATSHYPDLKSAPLPALRTRFKYSNNFIGYYDLIFNRKMTLEEKQKLKSNFIFLKQTSKRAQEQLEAICLGLVLDHPDLFPRPFWSSHFLVPGSLIVNNSDLEKWIPQLIASFDKAWRLHPPQLPFKREEAPKTPGPERPSEEKAKEVGKEIDQARKTIESNVLLEQRANLVTEESVDFDKFFTVVPASPRSKVKEHKTVEEIFTEILKKEKDPLVSEEVDLLSRGFVELRKVGKSFNYTIYEKDLDRLTDALKSQEGENQKKLDLLKSEILSMAKKSPTTGFGFVQNQLALWSGATSLLKFEELLVNYAKQDGQALKGRNSALTNHDVQQIYSKIQDYLSQATQNQQYRRGLTIVQQIKALPEDQKAETGKDLMQQLANTLSEKRCYQPADHPAYLVFEHFADILLRPNQVKMIDDFLKGIQTNPVMELIMGSGKSKVLLPLLGLLRADGQKLSMVLVTQPLYQSVSSDTQEIMRDAFGTTLHSLEFDRNTTFDEISLRYILEELKSIKENKECLIMTHKSMHCLILKFVELSVKHFSEDPTAEWPPDLVLLREILHLMSKDGVPLLDEADQLLSILHVISFSLGRQNPIPPEEINVTKQLYDILYNDKAIKALARVETDVNYDKSAPLLTMELYETSVKRALAEAFLRKHLPFESAEDQRLALDYLCRTKKREKEAQQFYDKQKPEVKTVLAMAGEEISNLLPHTLLKPCDEKYGLDDKSNGIFAIPYSAAGAPNYGSEFANHHVTMNYTIQYYMKKGMTKDLLVQQINKLQVRAKTEMEESKGLKTLQETDAWEIFSKIRGKLNIPLFAISDKQVDMLVNEVNASPATRLELIQKVILPQIVVYDQKISSTSHNLASFFHVLSGFVGCLWNASSFHRKISPSHDLTTDAITVRELLENSYDAVHIIQPGSPKAMMKELQNIGIPFDMVADAGGYFKEADNQKNAETLAETTQKPVVFYDKKGDQMIWDGKTAVPLSESEVKEHERETFLDQAHTTGADVKQKTKAVSCATIGPHMLLRDLLQTVWRLRGLAKGQRVVFIISKDVEIIIRQMLNKEGAEPLTFADILKLCIINQAKQKGNDNFKAFTEELSELSQKALLDTLLNPRSTPKECAQAVNLFGSSWIKDAFAGADKLYGQIPVLEESEKVVIKLAEVTEKQLAAKRVPTDEISKIVVRYRNKLPLFVSKVGDNELTVELEKRTFTEKQVELEQQAKVSHPNPWLVEIFEGDKPNAVYPSKYSPELVPLTCRDMETYWQKIPTPLPIVPLEWYLEQEDSLKDYAKAFEGINISMNMLQCPMKTKLHKDDIKFFGPYAKPIHYLTVDEKDNIVLHDNRGAYLRHKAGHKNLYNLRMGFMNSKEKVSPEAFKKIVKAKFLSGDSNYSYDELKILREWLIENNPKKMYQLFVTHILGGHMNNTQDFVDSPLQRLFKELLHSS